MSEVTCVLCDSKLESKTALQEHFRRHANKEIDFKGRPVLKALKGHETAQGTATATPWMRGSNVLRSVTVNEREKAKQTSVISNADQGTQITFNQPASVQRRTSETPADDNSVPSSSSSTSNTSTGKTPKLIPCDVCDVKFEDIRAAITHKWRKHPNQPSNFCCAYCGKLFPLRSIRDSHVASQHTTADLDVILTCGDCGDKFFNEAARDYHINKIHKRIGSVLNPVATPPPSKKIRLNNAGEAESVYYCHLCGSEYIVKYNLRKHLEQRHSDDDTNFDQSTEIIKCTICEAIFCNKRAYELHNMYHKPTDMYVTSEEHRLQIVSRVDQDFDLRRVLINMPKTVQGFARQQTKLVLATPYTQCKSRRPITDEQTPSNIKSPTPKAPRKSPRSKKLSKAATSKQSSKIESNKQPSPPAEPDVKGKTRPKILRQNQGKMTVRTTSPVKISVKNNTVREGCTVDASNGNSFTKIIQDETNQSCSDRILRSSSRSPAKKFS